MSLRHGLARAPRLLLPLAVAAALLALLVPSGALAERSDLVLAALVLFTALGIPPSELATLRARKGVVASLVLAPFALLVAVSWAVSRLFDEPVREGVLALGVASTEVAALGLVALAGGSELDGGVAALLRDERSRGWRRAGVSGGWKRAVPRALGSRRRGMGARRRSGAALDGRAAIELRDFAVAAALAAEAFGPPAAAVAAVYGVLMLLVGAASAQLLASARRGAPERGRLG